MPEAPPPPKNERKARVLATDDRPEVLRLIDRSLGKRYECEFAGSVEEARAKLEDQEFDLAICDIQMPGESGLVLVEELATEHLKTAIILVTGVDDPGVAEQALRLGTSGYLVKPFWPGQLLITAINALRRHELELAHKAHNRTLEKRIQMLMDTAPVPIYIKDLEFRYLIANQRTCDVAGMAPDALVGLTDESFMTPEGARAVRESDAQVIADGKTYEGEETFEIDGEMRTFLSVKFPFVDDEGRRAGLSGVSTDITDKKRAEELRDELAVAQARAIAELRDSRQETVERLALAIEMHDAETGRHVNRMAAVAALLAEKLGLDAERTALLRTAAPMHDVGKVATPDAILRKSGGLSDEERGVMETHTTVGSQILSGSESELLQLAAQIALSHHERWDGGGYPHGLSGEAIPLEGRIVAVADAFDAMLSDRSYRPALSIEAATETISAESGTHFDPRVVEALLANLDRALALRG